MSEYISNLNTIPSAHELAAQQAENEFNLEADLALYTNASGWDFDVGELGDLPPSIDHDPIQEEKARRQNASPFNSAVQPLDLLNGRFPRNKGQAFMANDTTKTPTLPLQTSNSSLSLPTHPHPSSSQYSLTPYSHSFHSPRHQHR